MQYSNFLICLEIFLVDMLLKTLQRLHDAIISKWTKTSGECQRIGAEGDPVKVATR